MKVNYSVENLVSAHKNCILFLQFMLERCPILNFRALHQIFESHVKRNKGKLETVGSEMYILFNESKKKQKQLNSECFPQDLSFYKY